MTKRSQPIARSWIRTNPQLSRLISRRAFSARRPSHFGRLNRKRRAGHLAICRGCFKVQMVMQRAARIEARPARRTDRLAIQVLKDGQLGPASAAQHRLLIELSQRPNPRGMTSVHFVTGEAGIVGPAAVEFYRDDIALASIVRAARARVYLDPRTGIPEIVSST